tara:strand:+ start:570 stop:1232 length:663 start_codon:yes stop_codon:yes gene_type:complete
MRRYYNKGSLVGGQVKLDKMGNNDGKISGEDFAVIRSQKMGGGMMKRSMYKTGGKVMGNRVGFDKGMSVKESGFKHKGKLEKEYKKIVGKDRKFKEPKDALFALERADVGVKFVDGLEKKGINTKKIREDILKEKMKSKEFRVGTAKGKSKASDDDEKKYRVYQKGGRVKKSMGGGLYENIHKKKARIAAGSGETMRKVGSAGAPTAQNFKDAAKTAKKV